MSDEKNLEDLKELKSSVAKVKINKDTNKVTVSNINDLKNKDVIIKKLNAIEKHQDEFKKKLRKLEGDLKRVIDFKKFITSKMPNIDANNNR